MAQRPRKSAAKASSAPKAGPHDSPESQATQPRKRSKPAAKPAESTKPAAKRKTQGGAAASKTKRGGSSTAEQRPSKPKAAGSSPAPRSTVASILEADAAPDIDAELNPRVRAFADEYLRDLNGTAAYLRIHPTAKVSTAGAESHRILKNHKVRAYIARAREQIGLSIDFTKQDVLRELVALATADPNELSQMRQVSCDSCWPDQEGSPPIWQEPNPECERCHGEGIPREWFADTRKLSPGARRLFAGVHVTKEGRRILMRDQDAALDRLAKIVGAYELDNEQKAAPVAEAVRALFGHLHEGAGRLPIARPQAKA